MTNDEAKAWLCRLYGTDFVPKDFDDGPEPPKVIALVVEAESRGRAEVQAQLDEAVGLLKKLQSAGLPIAAMVAIDDFIAYDARAAAKKGNP